MIKLLDVQVASTQEGGRVDLSVWSTAFKSAVDQRARVVNVSVICPWKEPVIKSLEASNTGILFLATRGNAAVEFDEQYRTLNGFDAGNVMLVGGCGNDGTRRNDRGYGAGIDLYVPSMNVPGQVAKSFAQEREYQRALQYRASEDQKLDKDRQRVRALEEQLATDPTNTILAGKLKREKAFLASGEKRLPTLSASAAEWPLDENGQKIEDCGVSFGIPMVANVAAKMILIKPQLTPRRIIELMKATTAANAVGAVMDPLRCYEAALAERRAWAARI